MKKFPPVSSKCPSMLHGGDYNPDQWLHIPQIIEEDFRLMKLARCNAMSVGIFSWAALEPREGEYRFGWLDSIMDRLSSIKAFAVLATPSGARPPWMAQQYPEVLRVAANRQRNLFGVRHNHCYTSPVYREKIGEMNSALAKRYKDHPALLLWHVSNEYGGECHCQLCQDAFREWLKQKYHDDLDALNRAWWTGFWAHTYSDWLQIESPAPQGEQLVHGHNLDWKRFVTDQTVAFMKKEIEPLKEITPDIAVTTNFMGTYQGLNYWKLAEHIDVISWDSYPAWHCPDRDIEEASFQGFIHDMCRSFKKGKPFMLMESTPSITNWSAHPKLKRPGVHKMASLLAIAHGSDTVQYFQWRKSRGGCEKFHGAVVDHEGSENSRVFRDVAEVGKVLVKLDEIVGTSVAPEVALIYDWENNWAIDDVKGLGHDKKYVETVHHHYMPFWNRGIPVDVVNMDQDFSSYKLLVAPMLYMVREGVGERITDFVREGGILVTTYWSGIVDENDLCFLGGFPGPLREVLGIRDEEIDTLYASDENSVTWVKDNALGVAGRYGTGNLCGLIHCEGARALATYDNDFYAGRPAVTEHCFGKGRAYYIAARMGPDFHEAFFDSLCQKGMMTPLLENPLPKGVTVQLRTDGETRYLFFVNVQDQTVKIPLGVVAGTDLCSREKCSDILELRPYGVAIIKQN